MLRKPRIIVVAVMAVAAVLGVGVLSFGNAGFDRRLEAGPGGELTADIELGSGVSFDKGSLAIRSHDENEVRVVAEISGWGEYAVDLDVSQRGDHVRVVGKVEGWLHWMFGGPTVDVRIFVPQDFTVNASIDGGPLLLEDLIGPVVARVADSDTTLRRAEGAVTLISDAGDLEVEDVEGSLTIANRSGKVDVSGVRGALEVHSERGSIEVSSVTGRVEISTERGSIELERIRGNVRASSDRGRIELVDVEGAVDLETSRGRIGVEDLKGSIHAQSERGDISVEFSSEPSGVIETARGSIEVEVPEAAGFDLDAHARDGQVELAADLDFAPAPEAADVAAGPGPAEALRDLRVLGREIAADIHAEVLDRVREQMEQLRRSLDERRRGRASRPDSGRDDDGDDAERDPWRWDEHQWRWDDPAWSWNDRDWSWDRGDWGRRWRKRHTGRPGSDLVGAVNGGGATLQLRTERGSIQIDED